MKFSTQMNHHKRTNVRQSTNGQNQLLIDYLNQVRKRTIFELRKAQEESLEYLRSKSLYVTWDSKDAEKMKSQLFVDKFYFQVLY